MQKQVKSLGRTHSIHLALAAIKGDLLAKPNYQFEKRQRDLAKKNKQEEKRRQKLADKAAADGSRDVAENPSEATPSDVGAAEHPACGPQCGES